MVAFAPSYRAERRTAHAKEVGKSRDDRDDGEGEAQPGQCQGRSLGDMPDVHAVDHVVQHVDELCQSHGQSKIEDVFPHLAFRKVIFLVRIDSPQHRYAAITPELPPSKLYPYYTPALPPQQATPNNRPRLPDSAGAVCSVRQTARSVSGPADLPESVSFCFAENPCSTPPIGRIDYIPGRCCAPPAGRARAVCLSTRYSAVLPQRYK